MMERAREGERTEAVEAAGTGMMGKGDVGQVARTVEAAYGVASVEGMKAALEELTGRSGIVEVAEGGAGSMDTR